MTDRMYNDLAALLTPAPSKGVQFSQGVVLSWNHTRLENQIEWRGITLTDVPIIEGINALSLKQGDVVGMLGWAPENAKGVGSWWILGKLSNPGEFVADLTLFLGQVRFRTTDDEFDQVYIGSDDDGQPFTVLYYGDEASTRAIQIANLNWVSIRDPHGNIIFENDSASQFGMGRPYLNYYLVPSLSAQTSGSGNGSLWPSTTSTSFIGLLEGRNTIWHPKFTYRIVTTTTGGGNVDWQILFDGVVAASGTGSSNAVVDVPGWGITIDPDNEVNVTVEVQATGGATRAFMQMTAMYGRQT